MFAFFKGSSQQGSTAMNFRQIDDGIAVAGQITEADLGAIAEAGFKTVICNRPDNEAGAVPHAAIARAAQAAGLEFRFIPVAGAQMTPEAVADMAAALADLPRPILAYCRSGARSANLYMLASRQRG